jgi:hypothetical protein
VQAINRFDVSLGWVPSIEPLEGVTSWLNRPSSLIPRPGASFGFAIQVFSKLADDIVALVTKARRLAQAGQLLANDFAV